MLRNLVLPLLVVLALGGIVVWLATRGTGGGEPSVSAEAPSAATPPVTADPTDLPVPEAPLLEERREVAETGSPEGQTAIEFDPTRTLEGRVVFPEGTPSDERAEVVLRVLPVGWEDDIQRGLMRWFGEWDEAARTKVGSGGRFVLPMPTEVEAIRLSIDAQYVYLDRRFEIEDLSDNEPIELEPRLGARVTFVLRPPPNTPHDAQQLVGRTVVMSHLPRNGFFSGTAPQVTFEVGANLTLEGRALHVDRQYSVDRSDHGEAPQGLRPFVVENSWDPILTAGEHMRMEIPLLEGLTLRGTVVDESGVPVEGAEVVAEAGIENWSSYYRAETDERGRFAMHRIYPALKALTASRRGYVDCELDAAELGSGLERTGFELVLTRGLSISGTLQVTDGRPAVGVHVKVRPSPGGRFTKQFGAETDAAGHFEVSGLEAGEYVVSAEGRFAAEAEPGTAAVPAPHGTEAPLLSVQQSDAVAGGPVLALVLEAAPQITGRVVDDRGRPVSTFYLEAVRENGNDRFSRSIDPMFFSEHEQSFKSEDGSFVWDEIPPGSWLIAARANGFIDSDPQAVVIPGGEPLEFVLSSGGSISGVVLDETGAPVHRAWISKVLVTPAMRSSGGNTSSDEQGRFRFEALAPGRYELTGRQEEFATVEPVEVVIEPGADRTGLELRLVRCGRILCEVRRPDGSPAAGATVQPSATGNPDFSAQVTTDGAGRAELGPFPPGEVLLTAHITDEATNRWNSASARVTVVSGEKVKVVIGGSGAAVTVRGRVTCAGEALANCYVAAYLDGGGRSSVVTGSDGSFDLGLSMGGVVRFRLVPKGAGNAAHFKELLPAQGSHEVAFELPGAGIRGRVDYGNEEDSTSRADVVAIRKAPGGGAPWTGEGTERASVSGDGTFALLHLEPGVYDLFANVSERFSRERSATAIQRGLEVRSGQVLEGVVLRPDPAGAVSGFVLGMNGQPIEGAFVFARRGDGYLPFSGGNKTDVDGSFSLTGLPLGSVLLEATAPGLVSGEAAAITVREEESTGTNLRLGAGTLLRCRIANEDLERSSLSVRIIDSRGHDRAVDLRTTGGDRSASDLERTYGPLPPGTYRVELIENTKPVFETSVEIRGEEDVEVVLGT